MSTHQDLELVGLCH